MTILGLHHIGHVVRDMREAVERYGTLGFTLPPAAYPVLPPAPGAPAEPFGVANTHAYFPGNFVELVTLVGGEATGRMPADARPIPLRVPDDRLAGIVAAIRDTTANLISCLGRFEGVHILMLDTDDVGHEAARLSQEGVGHGGVHAVQRPVETAQGTRMEPVRFLEIDGTAPGLVAEGRVGLAENAGSGHGPHPNGATGLLECVLCVADAELSEVEERYTRYLGVPARAEGAARVFDLRDAAVTLVGASALGDLLPGERCPALPGFAAYTLATRDADATERFLRGRGVPLGRTAGGEIFVPSEAALGVAIVFRAGGGRRSVSSA
ncbi:MULTISPECIES: VOC family protein [Nonomuraea]|uniref:VOC family protein n=1 Tax=Nonomuraea mangrovi TaxID=2316207 RepID=A0ABW4STL2_9ACTN